MLDFSIAVLQCVVNTSVSVSASASVIFFQRMLKKRCYCLYRKRKNLHSMVKIFIRNVNSVSKKHDPKAGFPPIRGFRENFEDFFQSGKSGKNRGFSAKIREKNFKSGNFFSKPFSNLLNL